MFPKILLTSRAVLDDAQSTPLLGVRQSYLDAVLKAGAYPFVAPRMGDRGLMEALVELADGVLIPGGEDVDPKRYGQEPKPYLAAVDKERDASEFFVIEAARRRRIPILGICRGCQVINVAFGGTLYQDINIERPQVPKHGSDDESDYNHHIRFATDSRLRKIIGQDEVLVNSYHHQAVKEVGAGLRATAHDSTGLIEGIEGLGPDYVLGVQCHPELLVGQPDGVWEKLFSSLVAACRPRA